jgi:acyl carrier protein
MKRRSSDNEIRATIESYLLTRLRGRPTPDENFFANGMVDSTFAMELVMYLEEEFQIRIADEELKAENFSSIIRLAGFAASKVRANNIE